MNNKVLTPVSRKSDERYRLTVGKEDAVLQIHRKMASIDFFAINDVLRNLSDEALRLYLYLVKLPLTMPWALMESVVARDAKLQGERYELALAELMEKEYLTPGAIDMQDKHYVTRCYHFWESPALRETQRAG